MKIKQTSNQKKAFRRIDYTKEEYLVDIESLLESLKIEKALYQSIFMELSKYDHTKMVLEACFTGNNFKKMKEIMYIFHFYGFNFMQISQLFGNFVSSKSISIWVHVFAFEKNESEKKEKKYDIYRKPIKIDFKNIRTDKEASFIQVLKLKIKIFDSQTGKGIYSLESSDETKDLRKKKQVAKRSHINAYKKSMNSK